jgi:site-specific recombinase XerD
LESPSTQSLIDRWTQWLATDAPRRLAPATIQEYQWQLVAFARWMETMLDVSFAPESITAYRMEQYVATLEAQVRSKARKSATLNKAVAALSSLGAWLVAEGACADTPARRLRSMSEQPGPPRALSPTVVTKLLDAAHHTGDLRDAVVVEILAFSGMRASEVAAMALEDLDVGLRTTWVQIVGKGHKRRRVPLPKRVGTLIQRYLDERRTREGQRPTNGPLLCPGHSPPRCGCGLSARGRCRRTVRRHREGVAGTQ